MRNVVIKKLKATLRPYKWKLQRHLQRQKLQAIKGVKNSFEGSKLILIPHADDEWVGCSAILTSMSDTVLLNCDMPGGDSPELHKRRYTELNKIAELFGQELITTKNDLCLSISDSIDKYKPEIIFVPYYFDWHEEHIAVMKALQSVIIQTSLDCKIAMYQVSLPLRPKDVTHILPFDFKEHHNKWRIFTSLYKTQLGIPYLRFAENERINGALCNAYAAEVFSVVNSLRWAADLSNKLLTENERNSFKAMLNDICLVRTTMETICK